jgi:uncharacterized protein (TIGR00251 family)
VARVTVKIHPRAKTTTLFGRIGTAYRLHVSAPPVDGRANDACIRFFAELMKVPKVQVSIIAGSTSRTKVLDIDGVTQSELESRLSQ